MLADTDYQDLARTLVQIYGEGALTYARRNMAALGAENDGTEQAQAWTRVAGIVERMVALGRRGRRSGDVPATP